MNYRLLDSGWLSSQRTGSQLGSAGRANSGSAITLLAPDVSSKSKALLSKEPVPASFDNAPVNVNGFENDTYNISLVIDKRTSAEYNTLYQLKRMTKTKGVKLLYPSATTDTIKSDVELSGSTSTNFNGNEVGASTPCLMGYVEDVSVSDSASSGKFRVSITFVVTG